MPERRGEVAAALVALVALGAWATGMPRQPPPVPPRVPANEVQPWMADALPGVGPKRREAAAAAIRSGRIEELPPAARAVAAEVFVIEELGGR